MDGTPATPQLFANIQFDEAKKGYDREQVRNFLSELSTKIGELQDMLREATVRAETAEAKVAEATKAKVLAETMAEKAKADAAKAGAAPAPAAEPVNEVEAAAGMLALAQQTAEAAIAAAEDRAKDVIADARSKAAMLVVEVEQEVERLKARATEEADALVAGRAEEVEAEVSRLESLRDGLQNDVHVLQSHLDEHRQKLRTGVEALAKLLDDGGFDPIPGGDGGSGPKSASSIFDAPAPATDADTTIDVTDAAPAIAEADEQAEPSAVQATDATAPAAEAEPALPVIEFVPEPEPSPAPALNLVAALSSHEIEAPNALDDAGRTDNVTGEHQPAELTIVTVEDLTSTPAGDDAFAPASRVDPETELRATQVASLLEAPETVASPAPAEPAVEEPMSAAAPAPAEPDVAPEPEPEPVQAAAPVAEPAVEAQPVVVAATGTDGASAPSKPVINLTAAKLFGEPTVEGDPTQAFDVLADDTPSPRLTLQRSDTGATPPGQSPLGEPDADADAAMRAFFEQDLAKLERDAPKPGRFRRR
jgi:cell division septum initiation protein DivIVA